MKLLISIVWIFLSVSAVSVHVSQAQRNMDMIKERSSLIFVLRAMFLSFHSHTHTYSINICKSNKYK